MKHCLHQSRGEEGSQFQSEERGVERSQMISPRVDQPPLRGYYEKSRNSYLLPPRGRERDKGLIKQGDILFLVAGG